MRNRKTEVLIVLRVTRLIFNHKGHEGSQSKTKVYFIRGSFVSFVI
jgi:hypothetical protein